MPTSTNLPTARTWIKSTTDTTGCRFVEARGCDAPLFSYEKAARNDFARFTEIFQKLLDKVQKGRDKSRGKPYLHAQFKALHLCLLKEIKAISKAKHQTLNPTRRRGAVSLGWQRERIELKGQYALEGMDPQHRFGNFWEKVWVASQADFPTTPEEFQALHDWANENEAAIWQMVPASIRGDAYVNYLDPQGRWRYQLTALNKKVCQNDDTGQRIPFDTRRAEVHDPRTGGKGRAIWVMGKNEGEWYAGSHVTGKFHHSSFLAGDLIVCGGEIVCKQGKVLFISNKTGHYQAGPRNLFNALRKLKHDVDFGSAQISLNLGQQMELWTTYEEFMAAEGLVERLGGIPISMDSQVRTINHRMIQESFNAPAAAPSGAPTQAAGPAGLPPDYQDASRVPTEKANAGVYVAATAIAGETDPVPITQVTNPDYQNV